MPHFSAGGPRGDPTEHLELQERSKADLKRRRLDVRLSLKERNRSRGRALRQAARSTRPVLTMRSGNLTQDRSNCMTDKTRSPGAWAHDRRQDDWAITPKIQQATSAPPKIRMTKPVRSDRRRPSCRAARNSFGWTGAGFCRVGADY